jgi:hypothetical protein
VTANEFRALALSLPETVEASHVGHPDFRVGGKIFATLTPDEERGMVKLTADQQSSFVKLEPKAFRPVNGGWGRRGATNVLLDAAEELTVRQALIAAWRNTAPKPLAEEFSGQ